MRIAVFTSGRQDWGILAPVVRELAASPRLACALIASGMHCRDGRRPAVLDDLPIDVLLPIVPGQDDDREIARVAGETTTAMAGALRRVHADALLVVGDRSETLAAGLAATCLRVPIIHLHGGEETRGAIDNVCRHALTRLAHLHAVAHDDFRRRLIAMGELPERVIVSGAPAIDLLLSTPLLTAEALAGQLGRSHLGSPLLVLTHHPTTLGARDPGAEIAAVLAGLEQALAGLADAQVVMTRANADAGGVEINRALQALCARDQRFILAGDLGCQRFWSLLATAQAMIGNSSSGILEAPCFGLPVVNIGDRQGGRLRIHPVSDVPLDSQRIAAAIHAALNAKRRAGPPTPTAYGDGHAAQRICAAIEEFAAMPPATRLSKGNPS